MLLIFIRDSRGDGQFYIVFHAAHLCGMVGPNSVLTFYQHPVGLAQSMGAGTASIPGARGMRRQ